MTIDVISPPTFLTLISPNSWNKADEICSQFQDDEIKLLNHIEVGVE